MKKKQVQEMIYQLEDLDTSRMYQSDFFHTWQKSDEEIAAVFRVAEVLRAFREMNISPRLYDSGMGISIFKDNSTRTRFSYASACNMLGLRVQDLDEKTSQIAHGETVRETATMIAFMAEVVGIRDDMYIGRGHTYMKEVAEALQEGYDDRVLEQRPPVINLQCDIDHPTQTMADMLHVINYFGGVENLQGKKLAMSWAYSPSYGKPLSVPQGVIGLFSRFGMDIVLAHPEGYSVMEEVEQKAAWEAEVSGGSYQRTDSMEEAFADADIVYPKSWAPFSVMEERTALAESGNVHELDKLEKKCLEENAKHTNWECTEEMMERTNNANALYLHCLPADITGVSCRQGEVASSVFDRYRVPLYKEASYKPYIIAAMILLSKFYDPSEKLKDLIESPFPRVY